MAVRGLVLMLTNGVSATEIESGLWVEWNLRFGSSYTMTGKICQKSGRVSRYMEGGHVD